MSKVTDGKGVSPLDEMGFLEKIIFGLGQMHKEMSATQNRRVSPNAGCEPHKSSIYKASSAQESPVAC